MDTKVGIVVICLVIMISACGLSRLPVAKPNNAPQMSPLLIPPAPKASFFSWQEPQKEEQLFYEGLLLLFDPAQEDSRAAQKMLESLLSAYPGGKWHNAAAGVLGLLKERDDCRHRLSTAEENTSRFTAEIDKARQQNEQLQQDIRLLNEKYQAEAGGLQQENEQLKKDLQLLQRLEIQLNTREKGKR